MRNQVFISSPHFESAVQWRQYLGKPDDGLLHSQYSVGLTSDICAKISYHFRRTPAAQSCIEICTSRSACARSRGFPNNLAPADSVQDRDTYEPAECFDCDHFPNSTQSICHSLLEGGTTNKSFGSVLGAALVTLSESVIVNMEPYDKSMATTIKPCGYLQLGNPKTRWIGEVSNADLGDEGLDRHDVGRFIQRSEQALSARFPTNSGRIRALIWELSDCKCKSAVLLAKLNVERLLRVSDSESLSRALNSPLFETQNICRSIWQTIPVQLRCLARRIFAWLVWAHRSLHIDELCAALHSYWNLAISTVHPSGAETNALANLGSSIAEVCGGLVFVEDDRTVRFIHYDIRKLLMSDPCTSKGLKISADHREAQEMLALTCLDTLTWQARRQIQGLETPPPLAESYMSPGGLGLTKYAVANWAEHCRLAETESHYVVGAIQEYLQYSFLRRFSPGLEVDKVAMVSLDVYARNTILHECALLGFVELCRTHLEMGADPNSKDALLQTSPLSKALGKGHWNIAALLIERGALPDQYMKGTNFLHHVSACGRIDIVAFLLQHGAHPNAMTKTAETPLHWAAMSDRPEVVRELVHAGGDANRATELTKETPLHFAAQLGFEQAVRSLLGSANVMARSSEHWTALHYAAAYGHTPIAKVLIEHGADMNAKTLSGRTALVLASEYGHKSVVSLLLSCSFEGGWPRRTKSSASRSSCRANSGIDEQDDLTILIRPENTEG